MLSFWVLFLIAAPLISASVIRFVVPQSEKVVSKMASLTKLSLIFAAVVTFVLWGFQGFRAVELDLGNLVSIGDYQFPLSFYLDFISFAYLFVIVFISAVIIRYCRYYLHREEGYARFFMTIFLFISGMNLIVTAGTLDLLFAGWEIVGISSFLLIAFYRERTLPVRNAFRAYFIYRICDVGLLLGIWVAHHLFSDARFVRLESFSAAASFPLLVFSLLMLLAASGKSAQFPFCFWLPRAMEGPTPSSAIFYGALSIHAGVFLLIRTFPIWYTLPLMRLIVGGVGVLSALVSTLSGRTQSNIKGQLAYASITQVGIMLIELSLGLRYLALLHVVANAFLKCYELLVSPSVVAQILRIQGTVSAGVKIADWSLERKLPVRLRSSLYVFALNEGYLEQTLRTLFLRPVGIVSKQCGKLYSMGGFLFSAVILVGAMGLRFFGDFRALEVTVVVGVMTVFSLAANSERKSASVVWNAVGVSCVCNGCLLLFGPEGVGPGLWIYFAGILPGWFLGKLCLGQLEKGNENSTLNQFGGTVTSKPIASRWFLVSALALVAFPVTPTFVGEDLILHICGGPFVWVAAFVAFSFVLNGLTLVRLYSRICLGPGSARINTEELSPTLSSIGLSRAPKGW